MIKLLLLTTISILTMHPVIAQQLSNERPVFQDAITKEDSLFTGFSCTVKENNLVELTWKKDSKIQTDYFVIERSYDGSFFETVGVLKVADSGTLYKIIDKPISNGSDFYRIKCSDETGAFFFSRVLQANLSEEADFKFYPNPADKMLIIRTSHDIVLQIVDSKGQVRLNENISPGMQVINVATLEKGPYVLKLTDKQSNRMVSEQLLKN
jgi:hypothetical protein